MKIQSSHDVVVERARRALTLKAEGKNQAEIASELGVKIGALHYYLYTVGKQLKKPQKRRGVVSVLGSPVSNGRGLNLYRVTHLLAEMLRQLPDEELVQKLEAAHEE